MFIFSVLPKSQRVYLKQRVFFINKIIEAYTFVLLFQPRKEVNRDLTSIVDLLIAS